MSKKTRNGINCTILILYIIAHIMLISQHEAWGDEAQAWTIAKNTSLFGLFPALCAEGHPAGWFILIKIFQALGLSFYNFSFLSLLLTTAALAVFLFESPLPLWVNIVVSFSSCFCYFNPVISRVYALAILIIILLASLYNKRHQCPLLFGMLIFFLFQTHILLAGFASSLMIIMILDSSKDRKSIPGTVITILGFIITVIELYPRSSVKKSVDYSLSNMLSNLSLEYIIEKTNQFSDALFTSFSEFWWLLCIILTIALFVWLIKTKKLKQNFDVLFLFICSFGFIFAVNIFIYNITIHAATLLIALSVFHIWILYPRINNEKFLSVITIALIVTLSLGSVHTWARSARSDYLRDFSENKRMADYICDNLESNSIIILKDEELTRVGVYAYVSSGRPDILFWCPDTNTEYTFYDWSKVNSLIDNQSAISSVKINFPSNNNIYLLSWHEENDDNLKLIFAANEFCEKNDPSWLYKFTE